MAFQIGREEKESGGVESPPSSRAGTPSASLLSDPH